MRNVDSSTLFIIFGVLFMMGMFNNIPFFIWAIIGYGIYRAVQSKEQEREREGRDRRRQQRWTGRRDDRQQRYEDERRAEQIRRQREAQMRKERQRQASRPPRNNPFKKSGMNKFKEYDYDGALEDFQKALDVDERDIAVHFNIACTYSLTENKEKALYHLNKAVEYGFKDFEKIKTHDALAYIRIQEEFEGFEQNGFRLSSTNTTQNQQQNVDRNNTLLEQLNQLSALREKGLLTEEEFVAQKKKLLG
ncbi:MAG: SHOCT domain-containing protein [Bacteroidota bacterium]